MMKDLFKNWLAVTICIIALIINNALVIAGTFKREEYTFRAQVFVCLFCLMSVYFRNVAIDWFGNNTSSEYRSQKMGKLFGSFIMLPPLFFSLYPELIRCCR